MLKRSYKYLIIAFLNFTVLTVLLALWTDEIELVFNDWVRPIEFLKIIGFTIASLVAMRILVYYFRKRTIVDVKTKVKIASVLALLISSYLYIDYSSKFITNRIINRKLREQIASKVKSASQLASGTRAESLTIREYQEISKIIRFPKLPNEATNISYSYEYDGFLPDYLFILTYYLPKETKVDTSSFRQGDFTKSQTVAVVDNKQRITYTEGNQ